MAIDGLGSFVSLAESLSSKQGVSPTDLAGALSGIGGPIGQVAGLVSGGAGAFSTGKPDFGSLLGLAASAVPGLGMVSAAAGFLGSDFGKSAIGSIGKGLSEAAGAIGKGLGSLGKSIGDAIGGLTGDKGKSAAAGKSGATAGPSDAGKSGKSGDSGGKGGSSGSSGSGKS